LGKVWTLRGRPAEGYLTKQGAQQLLDELLVGARKSGPAAARRDHHVTYARAAQEWLRYVEHDRRRRPSTLRDYRRMANDVLVPLFGEVPLRAFTPELIGKYRAHLVARAELAPRTIKHLLVLHAIFKRAQRHYGLASNPVAGVERQPVGRAAGFRVLSAEEVAALGGAAREGHHRTAPAREVGETYQAVLAQQDAQDAAIYTVAAYAGLRLGELRALRWRDVDFSRRLVHVRRAFTQGAEDVPESGTARAVPMTETRSRSHSTISPAAARGWPTTTSYSSRPRARTLEGSALRRRFYAALDAAGIAHLRFHDLRHAFGALAAAPDGEAGV
jgi:integrase